MSRQKTFNRLTLGVCILAGIIFLMSAWLWWTKVYQTPARVFEDMLNNNLKTTSVVRTSAQENENGGVRQKTQLIFKPQLGLHALTTIKQTSDLGENKVTTETASTPTGDFVRYVDIQTAQKNSSGKPLNFAPVLNLWAKSNNKETGEAQFFSEAALNVFVFGNLSRQDRQELTAQMRKSVYKTDYGKVMHVREQGRKLYAYDVKIKPTDFVEVFERYTKIMGLSAFSQLDSSTFKSAEPIDLTVKIDALSHQLVSVTYKDSNLTEHYSGFGLVKSLQLPKESVTVEEIQSRLSAVQ